MVSFVTETYVEPDFYAGDDIRTKDGYVFPAGLTLPRGAVVSAADGVNVTNDDAAIAGVTAHEIDTTNGAATGALITSAKIIRSKLTVAGAAITDAQDAALRNLGIITMEAE